MSEKLSYDGKIIICGKNYHMWENSHMWEKLSNVQNLNFYKYILKSYKMNKNLDNRVFNTIINFSYKFSHSDSQNLIFEFSDFENLKILKIYFWLSE